MTVQYPHFIIVRDRYECLLQLIDWLERAGQERIYLVDNDSTYPPLVEYLNTTVHTHLPMWGNHGHTVGWTAKVFENYAKGEYFVLTDPDVVPDENCPMDAHEVFREALREWKSANKVGFSLRIDDLPDHYAQKEHVIAHESQYWFGLDKGLYHQPIDTTFALHRPRSMHMHAISPAIRTAPPYQARHMAWYQDSANLTEDEAWYRSRADPNVTTWCK